MAGTRVPMAALKVTALVALSVFAFATAAQAAPQITFYFGLARPEARATSAFFAVQQPGSSTYRRFLSPGQAAARYGASRTTRIAFVRAMRGLGLSARVDPSGVFARVRGTVAQLERAFAVRITQQAFDAPPSLVYSVTGRTPRLPRSLAGLVHEVVPIFVRSASPSSRPRPGDSAPPRPPSRHARAPAPANAGTWTRGCAAARATGAYSFAQVRHAYGLDAAGAGAGGSVAILTDAEAPLPGDVAASARCFGLPPDRVKPVLTDAQAHPFGPSTPEPQEDLELVRGMAPALRSVLLAEAWGTQTLWFLAPAKLLTLAQRPDALSISYGFCERQVLGRGVAASERAGVHLLDSLLVRLGLTGTGVFASAGDFGSSCNGLPFPGVAWPGSSPYLTSVGGSRLIVNRSNLRVNEVAWNDLRWLTPSNGGGAGGGGISSYYARLPFQRGLGLPGRGRAVPDVAAHASMLPGWPIVFGGNWITDSGTSASAPLLASAFAVLSARERAAHRPSIGPVNGLLYWLRRNDPATLFDIVSGTNGYFRGVPGWPAKPGYDLASGVGVPQFARLAGPLPPPARYPPSFTA
jgi:subtilase family serine protease